MKSEKQKTDSKDLGTIDTSGMPTLDDLCIKRLGKEWNDKANARIAAMTPEEIEASIDACLED